MCNVQMYISDFFTNNEIEIDVKLFSNDSENTAHNNLVMQTLSRLSIVVIYFP